MKNVRAQSSLDALPVGAKIQFDGKRITFRYVKREDGIWTEPLKVAGEPNVKRSAELAETIGIITNGGFAQVLQ